MSLVSSLVSRAEDLSSPYVASLRQRSALVDRTASRVVELARTYEVEAYVKKADELAEKAASEASARRDVVRAKYAEQVKAFEQLATTKVDTLACSVVTLVDRLIPEDEESRFDSEAAPSAQVRQVPSVLYRRANRAAGELSELSKAKRAATVELVFARKEDALRFALTQKDAVLAVGRRGTHTLTQIVFDLRDEAELRTMPMRDALLDAANVRRAQLQLRYKETLAVLAAKRGVATQMAWAKMQETGADAYALQLRDRAVVARSSLEAALASARVRAAERTGDVRTLYVEYRHKIVAVSVNAREQLSVKVVAVRDELTGRYEAVRGAATSRYSATSQQVSENLALARAQVVENLDMVRGKATEARETAKARTAAIIAETKRRTAEQKERVEKLANVEQLKERSQELKAKVVTVAGTVQKETPALAGQLTTRVLGEVRGQQVEKQVATLLQALPVLAVA